MKRKLWLIMIIIPIYSCIESSERESNEKYKVEITEKNNIITTQNTFKDWWDFNYNNLPSVSDSEHIKKYDIVTLLKYYRIFTIELFNTKGSGRYSNTSIFLAEKMNVRKELFDEINNYFGLTYYKHLGNITKKYFKDNKLGIIPDYYTPINNTVYIGEHTFNCDIILKKCKDDLELQNEIDRTINYLINNLPNIIQGFRVFSVSYECETTGTSGSMNIGYLWKRSNNQLLLMPEGKGSYSKQLPEDTLHWQEDSWNDGNKIINDYSL